MTYVSAARENPSNIRDDEGQIRSNALRAVNCVYMESSTGAAEFVTQLARLLVTGGRQWTERSQVAKVRSAISGGLRRDIEKHR